MADATMAGDVIPFIEWVRLVEIPMWIAMGTALVRHMVVDSRVQAKLVGDNALLTSVINALKSEVELKATKAAGDVAASTKEVLRAEMAAADRRVEGDIGALNRQLAGVQLEIATHYMKRSDVHDHMAGVETRMVAAIADLKNDFKERLDALTRLLKPADKGLPR